MRNVRNVLIIAPHYNTFVKELTDATANYVSNVTVLAHHNYFSELAPYLPFSYFRHVEKFSKKKLMDLKGKPENVEVNIVSMLYFIPDGRNQGLGDRLFRRIKERIKNNEMQFDLIHAHFTWPCGYVGAKLREKYDIPLIITIHENREWFLNEYNSEDNNIYWTWKNADALIRVNKVDVPYLKRFNERVFSIPNGYNPHKFFKLEKSDLHLTLPELPIGKKILFTFSNLAKRKGFQYLITAIRMLINNRKDFICIIGGDGEYKNTLQKQIDKLKLNDYVWLIGFVQNDKINAWLNACDLFVLPSLSESFGIVQIEAMACGKPVVATRNGGSEEIIINDKLGILVEPKDPEGLAQAIHQALETNWDEDYIRHYTEQFTWDGAAKQIMALYGSVMKK